ncbi:DUF6096 family protein [Fonticella tunisiensis]|uniref:Uncharacterized protein n=1 Tax=Fonticella tunisiensis TaxID=1096341 RepID=A0A4R7KTJ1_9CLOT|nr:DUF6096 family protein [Fonticella tunisiensis]TDT63427.1 hypothetical protein EDD71_102189 [Fonticella tunisiensis]
MKYHVINMAGRELKCRLNTQNTIAVEKKLGGKNILKILMDDQIPSLDMVLNILHASLQALEHGYTLEKVYELYDEYVDEGKTYIDLVPELINVLEVSGFFKRPPQEEQKDQEN